MTVETTSATNHATDRATSDRATNEQAVTDPAVVEGAAGGGWTFLTNHSHVLICLRRDPHMRLRDLAEAVGITERAVQGIVRDLEEGGCLTRHREGRRNRYVITDDRPMRHRVERSHVVGELLDAMAPESPTAR